MRRLRIRDAPTGTVGMYSAPEPDTLAELLREQGEILDLQGRPAEATVARAKALDIFLEIDDAYDAPELAERHSAMERMIGRRCAQERVGSSS